MMIDFDKCSRFGLSVDAQGVRAKQQEKKIEKERKNKVTRIFTTLRF